MIGRRFFYCLLLKILDLSFPEQKREKYQPVAEKALKYIYLGVLELIFLVCNWRIFQNYNIVYIFYLIYP